MKVMLKHEAGKNLARKAWSYIPRAIALSRQKSQNTIRQSHLSGRKLVQFSKVKAERSRCLDTAMEDMFPTPANPQLVTGGKLFTT